MPFCWKKNHFLKGILSVIFEHVSVCVCTCLSAVYVYFLTVPLRPFSKCFIGPSSNLQVMRMIMVKLTSSYYPCVIKNESSSTDSL